MEGKDATRPEPDAPVGPACDVDDDGVPDAVDNCPPATDNGQEDADKGEFCPPPNADCEARPRRK